MFSSTTVESSTSIPITSDMPSNEIVSIVRCITFIAVIAIASEVGIEMQTTIALRHDRKKKSIAMQVQRIARESVRTTMTICCCVNLDCTLMTWKEISGNCRSICGSARNALLDASTSLACDVF